MKNGPSPKAFEDLAAEMKTEPAFVEKEWNGIQLLARLTEFTNTQGGVFVFTGGTCLSRAHGIIQRFSEDLDFIVSSEEEIPRSNRRMVRKSLLAHLSADARFDLVAESEKSSNESRFFEAHFNYRKTFEHPSLRPYLKLEVSFRNSRLDTSRSDIRSNLAEHSGSDAEAYMECISPVETAADKISALTWRAIARDEGVGPQQQEENDPNLVRHLHDLAALKSVISDNEGDFVRTACAALKQDQLENRGGVGADEPSMADRLGRMVSLLENKNEYREEYRKFVGEMSYAKVAEQVDYEGALDALSALVPKIVEGVE